MEVIENIKADEGKVKEGRKNSMQIAVMKVPSTVQFE